MQAALDFNWDSPLKSITNGSTKLTVFSPDDTAFKNFARTVTGKSKISEKEAVDAILATVSVDPPKTVTVKPGQKHQNLLDRLRPSAT